MWFCIPQIHIQHCTKNGINASMNSAGFEGTVCCVLSIKHGLLWHPDTTDHNSVRKNRTGPCLLNLAAIHSTKEHKMKESVAGKLQL